jgi:hypothetical protein
MEFCRCFIRETAVENLSANEWLLIGKSVSPYEACNLSWPMTDWGEIEKFRGRHASILKSHHRVGTT